MTDLEQQIGELWEHRDNLTAVMPESDADAAVRAAIDMLDTGEARVAELVDDKVVVHEWLKQAILLLFRLAKMETLELGPFEYADKIPLKHDYEEAGVRVVPGGSARWGSFVARGAVLMPSYVNIGAHVGEQTMVDTWATVGSGAQIGKNVHLSGGVGVGGVLEPPNAVPVVSAENTIARAVAVPRKRSEPPRQFITKYTLNDTPTPSSSGSAMILAKLSAPPKITVATTVISADRSSGSRSRTLIPSTRCERLTCPPSRLEGIRK